MRQKIGIFEIPIFFFSASSICCEDSPEFDGTIALTMTYSTFNAS